MSEPAKIKKIPQFFKKKFMSRNFILQRKKIFLELKNISFAELKNFIHLHFLISQV